MTTSHGYVLLHGKLPALGEVGYFLAFWAMTFVGLHGWMWEYFTWGRGRHSRR